MSKRHSGSEMQQDFPDFIKAVDEEELVSDEEHPHQHQQQREEEEPQHQQPPAGSRRYPPPPALHREEILTRPGAYYHPPPPPPGGQTEGGIANANDSSLSDPPGVTFGEEGNNNGNSIRPIGPDGNTTSVHDEDEDQHSWMIPPALASPDSLERTTLMFQERQRQYEEQTRRVEQVETQLRQARSPEDLAALDSSALEDSNLTFTVSVAQLVDEEAEAARERMMEEKAARVEALEREHLQEREQLRTLVAELQQLQRQLLQEKDQLDRERERLRQREGGGVNVPDDSGGVVNDDLLSPGRQLEWTSTSAAVSSALEHAAEMVDEENLQRRIHHGSGLLDGHQNLREEVEDVDEEVPGGVRNDAAGGDGGSTTASEQQSVSQHATPGAVDSGGRFSKSRRCVFLVVLLASVCILGGVGVAVGVAGGFTSSGGGDDGEKTQGSTPANPVRDKPVFSWNQLGNDLDGEAAFDLFGSSVALSADGTVLAVGAKFNEVNGYYSGHVRVFKFDTAKEEWEQLGEDLDGNKADLFGYTVSLSSDGSTLASGTSRVHRVYQYSRVNNTWIQLGSDFTSNGRRELPDESSVALSDDGASTTLASVINYGGESFFNQKSAVRVFRYNDTSRNWDRLGGDFSGDENVTSVDISESGTNGLILVAGSPPIYKERPGNVRVYQYDSVSRIWKQLGQPLIGERNGDWFGSSVRLDGSSLAVSSPHNPHNDVGYVRVYRYDSVSMRWIQLGGDIRGKSGSRFGDSIALSAERTILSVGASGDSDHGKKLIGAVHLFQFDNMTSKWERLGSPLVGEAEGDEFGFSVDMSSDGSILAAGGYKNDGSGKDAGHVRVFRGESN